MRLPKESPFEKSAWAKPGPGVAEAACSAQLTERDVVFLRISSKTQSEWLATSEPSLKWLPEWAGNLGPVLCLFQFEETLKGLPGRSPAQVSQKQLAPHS